MAPLYTDPCVLRLPYDPGQQGKRLLSSIDQLILMVSLFL